MNNPFQTIAILDKPTDDEASCRYAQGMIHSAAEVAAGLVEEFEGVEELNDSLLAARVESMLFMLRSAADNVNRVHRSVIKSDQAHRKMREAYSDAGLDQ